MTKVTNVIIVTILESFMNKESLHNFLMKEHITLNGTDDDFRLSSNILYSLFLYFESKIVNESTFRLINSYKRV